MKLAASSVLLICAAAQAQHLRMIGPLPNWVVGLTDNGQCIYGFVFYGGAWRWTPHAGVETFPNLPNLDFPWVSAASADGSVLVGFSSWSSYGYPIATRWDDGQPGEQSPSEHAQATAVSADGSIVAGEASGMPIRWTNNGHQTLPLSVQWSSAAATAITPDGSIVVGLANTPSARILFRWAPPAGHELLATLPLLNVNAPAVSADGNVIVCSAEGEIRRWTPAGGLQSLGALPGRDRSAALDMDHSGDLIVGTAYTDGMPSIAIVWTAKTGIIPMREYLGHHGIQTAGWNFGAAIGVSGDGLTIAGYGSFAGQGGVWIATLPGGACYANCDASTTAPILNVGDFACFVTRFAAGDPYANCDQSTAAPVLNLADFTCYLQRFAGGCP
jgi:uncharacterized membrane protein